MPETHEWKGGTSRVDSHGDRTIPGILVVAASDFGWGSLGKLRLILDELTDVRTTTHPVSPSRWLSETLLGEAAPPPGAERATAALVVNDPVLADRIAAEHIPVIYVDSLPYLRHSPDEIARRAALYCAQRWPGQELDAGSPLARLENIRWVEPIVPRQTRRPGGAGTVINVGGMNSHLSGGAPAAYLRTVVIPLVESFARRGKGVAAVCGNLPAWACEEIGARLPGAAVGAQSPYEFERTLRTADTLITSPGSTTLLQAAALHLPTALLPPQNLSVASWPTEVIDRQRVDALRAQGEDAVIDYIYSRIVMVEQNDDLAGAVWESVRRAVESMPGKGALRNEVQDCGHTGASQIARCVRQTMLVPAFRHDARGGKA
jgi:hydroxymethylcytosylglucuronate/cytosylglucuronate synthase